jgi:CRP/FNR family transcriptional regulator
LVLVGTGELKVSLASEEGREQIVRLASPGQLVVEGFTPTSVCPVSVVARIPTDVWVFPSDGVERLCRERAELSVAIMSSMAFAARRMADALYDVSLHPVEQRLATFILGQVTRGNAAPEPPLVIERTLDVNTIASMLGTVREEITRAQSRLRRRGVLDLSRDRVTVLDLDALIRIASN